MYFVNPLLTNLHIKTGEPVKSIAFDPDPRPVEPQDMELVKALLEQWNVLKKGNEGLLIDFTIECHGDFWRGHLDLIAVDGSWLRFRKMLPEAPNLDKLPSPISAEVKRMLLSDAISRGGLIHIAGGPGSGKTTTGSAVVISRLLKFGGVAYTVEDPPELPLNGWHGKGYCTQACVAGDSAAAWDDAMRGVLRSQPSGTKLMLYVGEIRGVETARAMLRAASNGFLVISTGFASDIISGLDTFFQLIGRESARTLADALRIIVYQNLTPEKRLTVNALVSADPSGPVANIIRSGNLAQLRTEIDVQQTQLRLGRSLLAA
jgi:twitching motility protein PilT